MGRSTSVASPVFVFVLKADPHGVERLGGRLDDGSIVDLQAAHLSMLGRPSALFRDRTAFRLRTGDAVKLAGEVLAWVETERPPGTMVRDEHAKVVDHEPAREGAPAGRRAPP